jgi:hypothetical protein
MESIPPFYLEKIKNEEKLKAEEAYRLKKLSNEARNDFKETKGTEESKKRNNSALESNCKLKTRIVGK